MAAKADLAAKVEASEPALRKRKALREKEGRIGGTTYVGHGKHGTAGTSTFGTFYTDTGLADGQENQGFNATQQPTPEPSGSARPGPAGGPGRGVGTPRGAGAEGDCVGHGFRRSGARERARGPTRTT